ncbi:hypothetical protein P3X46_005957 [Hevea brasiliensis]|uniref:MATH domain-containing protein n=1 Tax=Hevea brasiliensis TaxID=3981 RepID=A0ABQ9MST6_HEVBR|nr:hypothetical protein P3X46_005957 [Hevea brasiliensis]
MERGNETELQSRLSGASITAPSTSGVAVQMLESREHAIGIDWENTNSSSISLDMKTPLSHFPPFRFGVEFDDGHRLSDGQVKHSPEYFYAGSLWKVIVQAFNDEDPQGRRTLGLFLHRRKAGITDTLRKVHMYVDAREKVTARFQLICPSKRGVMVFGSFEQRGTLLPKAPKGWAGVLLCFFMSLQNYFKMGPYEWLPSCSLCKLKACLSKYQLAHLVFCCFRCKSQEYSPFAPFWLLCCASMISRSDSCSAANFWLAFSCAQADLNQCLLKILLVEFLKEIFS